jgi:hypothetical protein
MSSELWRAMSLNVNDRWSDGFVICVVCAAMSDVTVAAAARDSSVVTLPAMYL